MKESTNRRPQALVSGWWLAFRPWHVRGLAQRELLSRLAAELDPQRVVVAWPRTLAVPDDVGLQTSPASGGGGPWGRLIFEQLGLPRAANHLQPEVVLVPYASAPLASASPVAALIDSNRERRTGGLDRLRAAAAKAGLAGAWRQLHWADEPLPASKALSVARLSPAVSPTFRPTLADDDGIRRKECGLPDSYVLALGASSQDVRQLLAGWSWMTPSLGEGVRLVIGPMGPDAASAGATANELGLGSSVIAYDRLPWEGLPAVIRGASCLLVGDHPGSWQILRWAMASGLPVAGVSSGAARAILGDAGYLVPAGDARALGAAGLSLVVDQDDLGRRLKETGLARAELYRRAWADGTLADALLRGA